MRHALIEPLRGVAALWVFCFHYGFSETFQRSWPAFHALLKEGHLGVPMSFVLSGFCIAAGARGSLRRKEPLRRFLRRRCPF